MQFDFPPLPDENEGINAWYRDLKKELKKKYGNMDTQNYWLKQWIIGSSDPFFMMAEAAIVFGFGVGMFFGTLCGISGVLAVLGVTAGIGAGTVGLVRLLELTRRIR